MLRGVYANRTIKELKKIAKGIDEESKDYTDKFEPIKDHPLGFRGHDRNGNEQILLKAYRNRRFVAQIYKQGEWIRISVNRAKLNPYTNTWHENVSWDDLMDVKNQLGYANYDAIEIYPKENDIVNVTNMRHLFIVPETIHLSCIWRKRDETS